MELTIKEIEERLKGDLSENDPFLKALEQDGRKGVQKLLSQWKKSQLQWKAERERLQKMLYFEQEAKATGAKWIAGVDEVGRGPLAGPVVAASVILPEDFFPFGANDSKKLTKKRREELYEYILKGAISVTIAVVGAEEIDRLNIYEATKKAMAETIQKHNPKPDYLLLDAMKLDIPIPQKSLIKGDSLSLSIASASIVAKVYRDRLMEEYGKQYPQYHFDKNMGYGTKEHLEALDKYGPCPIHRKSFAPVKDMMEPQLQFNLE